MQRSFQRFNPSKICRKLRNQHFLGFFAINEEIYAGFCFHELLDQFCLADPAPSCEYYHWEHGVSEQVQFFEFVFRVVEFHGCVPVELWKIIFIIIMDIIIWILNGWCKIKTSPPHHQRLIVPIPRHMLWQLIQFSLISRWYDTLHFRPLYFRPLYLIEVPGLSLYY